MHEGACACEYCVSLCSALLILLAMPVVRLGMFARSNAEKSSALVSFRRKQHVTTSGNSHARDWQRLLRHHFFLPIIHFIAIEAF